jgi:hypothetical protein
VTAERTPPLAVKCPACAGHGQVLCGDCKGKGKSKCSKCEGSGRVKLMGAGGGKVAGSNAWGVSMHEEQCLACRGEGFSGNPCPTCKGHGTLLCSLCNGEKRVSHSVFEEYKKRIRDKRSANGCVCLLLFVLVIYIISQNYDSTTTESQQQKQHSIPSQQSPEPLPTKPAFPKIHIPPVDISGMDEVFSKRLQSYASDLKENKIDDVIFDATWGIEERDTRKRGWAKYERQAKKFLELATAAKEGRLSVSVADSPRISSQQPKQSPLPEPELPVPGPDWDARYHELYATFRDQFVSPKIGDYVALQLANGSKFKGTLVEQDESRLGLRMNSGAVVGFDKTQLDTSSRVALFRDDYATLRARRQVKTEQDRR